MLVLMRKLGERICIGPEIWIEVVEIKGHAIRLGIVAPKEVRVMRSELLDRPQPVVDEEVRE